MEPGENRRPSRRGARPVAEPLGMPAIPGPIHVAAIDSLVGLDQIELLSGHEPTDARSKRGIAPGAPDVERDAAQPIGAASLSRPLARDDRQGNAFLPKSAESPLHKSF